MALNSEEKVNKCNNIFINYMLLLISYSHNPLEFLEKRINRKLHFLCTKRPFKFAAAYRGGMRGGMTHDSVSHELSKNGTFWVVLTKFHNSLDRFFCSNHDSLIHDLPHIAPIHFLNTVKVL